MPLVPRHLKPKYLGGHMAVAMSHSVPRAQEALENPERQFRRTLLRVADPRSTAPQRLCNGAVFLVCCFLLVAFSPVHAAGVLVRDLTMVSGARDNQLVGYGIVAGLAGDGDKDPVYTRQTVANL